MRILFLVISFSEDDHISMYEEFLQEFVKNGHEVFVACASEKRKGRNTSLSMERGIRVLRIRTGNITENRNLIEKGLSTIEIDGLFRKAIVQYYGNEKFDLILYPTPPITLARTVAYLKKRCNATCYLLLKDIFPQNAIDLGMLSKSGIKGIIYQFFRFKEKRLYEVSDFIGCMSPANVRYVLEHNPEVNQEKVEVCPNCLQPTTDTHQELERIQIRKKYRIPTEKKVFLYGGNLGRPQGIEFFLKCILECKNIADAYFLIVGGGSEANRIKSFLSEHAICNAALISTLPKAEYEMLAGSCDVGLVFLDYRFTIPNFPSRILSYMQNAKPVIVASDPVTDMGDIVKDNGFGWKCMSNDVDSFVSCVTEALSTDLQTMGENGRRYFQENYCVEKGYKIIMRHFNG